MAATAFAATPGRATDWTFGLGAGYGPDYEGSDDYHAVPLWNIKAAGFAGPTTYAQLFATQFTSNLINDKNWRLGLFGQFQPDYDDVDNNRVQHMDGVDPTLMVGVMGGYDWILGPAHVLGVEIQASADVLHGNGYIVTFGPNYTVPFGNNKWLLKTGLNTTYGSKDYMQNYFSVSNKDVQSAGFSKSYTADDGFKDVAANLSLTYLIDKRWSLTGVAKYERMVDQAADSPVVDDEGNKNQWFGGLLVNYSF
ncbi:MAG: MipA/OmpV family protein [Geminicoccaceae bacterium]